MKITILALHLGYGGIEKFISNIANMFAEENQVEIISVYKLYDKPSFYINTNVKITYLLEKLKPNREEFYVSLKKFNIFQTIKQAYIALKILYLKKHEMKKAIKKIDSDIVISTIVQHNKLLSKYGKKNIKKIATEHNYNLTNNSYINKVSNSCKGLDYLVIASKKLAELYIKRDKCKVKNIPLSLDYIPNCTSNLKNKSITYIGRLSKEKGVLDLIDVFKKVNEIDKNVILNIIGDGTQKDEMLAKIKEFNLENKIIMHGYKDKHEIENILLKTSVSINTSYTESFGLAVLEAFSYGIPCVAFSSAEGLSEFLKDGENGYIIKNRDFDEMANKILYLIKNQKKKLEFGRNARYVSMRYDKENIKKMWYTIIIGGKKW